VVRMADSSADKGMLCTSGLQIHPRPILMLSEPHAPAARQTRFKPTFADDDHVRISQFQQIDGE
jgi:hypothetical protein